MYKALVIGCGNIGAMYDFDNDQIQTHVKALHLDPGFIFSIFDIDKELENRVSLKYGCEVVDILDEKTLNLFDCVSICTPTNSHAELLKRIINSAIRLIICEKPISNNLAELEEIKRNYNMGNLKIVINYSRRFQPAFKKLKSIISGLLKNEILINIDVRYQKGFLNNCSHAFDIIEYLTNSSIDLNSIKLHNKVFDHFDDDPTVSLQATWGKTNLNVTGFVNLLFSLFEIDFYFESSKICIKNAGDNFEFYHSKKQDQFLQPLYIQNELSRSHCMQDYMSHVIKHAYELLKEERLDDNFDQSINLNLKMLKYLNN